MNGAQSDSNMTENMTAPPESDAKQQVTSFWSHDMQNSNLFFFSFKCIIHSVKYHSALFGVLFKHN